MLSATATATNSAQNCLKLQNLPKSVQRQNFEIPPKIEILVFLRVALYYWWRRPPVKNSRGIMKYDWLRVRLLPIIFQNSPRILDQWPSPPVV
jgi:hypothetical protein